MNRLFRELMIITLRTSLMTVGVFLAAWGVLTFLFAEEGLSVGLGGFGGAIIFGLLLSLPFAFPLALGGVTARLAYNRFAYATIPSDTLRSWVIVLLIAGLGLLSILLWLTVQGFNGMNPELESALYIAGAVGGGAAGYWGANGGRAMREQEG